MKVGDLAREKAQRVVILDRLEQVSDEGRAVEVFYRVQDVNGFGFRVGESRIVSLDELNEEVRHVGGPKTGITKSKRQRREEAAAWQKKPLTRRAPVQSPQ